MTALDIVLVAAMAIFVAAWWARALPARRFVLAGAALAAAVAAAADLADDRWQAALGLGASLAFLLTLLVNRLRRSHRRAGVPFVSGSAFGALAAAAAAALWLFPVDPLPRPSGPHPVGVRSFELRDASRLGVMAAPPGAPRRLLVRVWYPAERVSGAPRRYFTEREADTTARGLGALGGFPPLFAYVKHVRTNSYENAPLMHGARNLPVVFYSHGYTAFLGQNTALMEELASHGYIVFSVQHTYDSSATAFPAGDVAPMDPALVSGMRRQAGSGAPIPEAQVRAMAGATLEERLDGRLDLFESPTGMDARIARSAPIWVADRMFVHDALQSGAVPADIRPIAAAGELRRVGEMGMSFGGSASGGLCFVDRRCAAAVNLDGGDFHRIPFDADIPVPFLMMHSDMGNFYRALGREPQGPARAFNEFSYERIAAAGARADVFRFQIRGARHLGYSDFLLFMRPPIGDGLLGSTPPSIMIGAQNDFVRGFFDRYLRGQANQFPARQLTAYREHILPADNADLPAWWASLPAQTRAAFEARIAAARGALPAAP